MKDYPVVSASGHLADNELWNIPAPPCNEVRGTLRTIGMWHIPVSYRALAMDMHGRVFGIRTMSRPRESGYVLEGRVKVEGRSYRAFTSSKMFTRADGSLCEVAILYVCGTPDKIWTDPLKVPREIHLAYVKDLHSRYFYQTEGTYYELAQYARALELIATGYAATVPYVGYEKQADELRAVLAPKMGWEVSA